MAGLKEKHAKGGKNKSRAQHKHSHDGFNCPTIIGSEKHTPRYVLTFRRLYMCIYTIPPPHDCTPLNGLADKVHRLKRELQDLSVGTTKLEEASFVVTSASVPLRLKGAAVLPAAASGGGGACS